MERVRVVASDAFNERERVQFIDGIGPLSHERYLAPPRGVAPRKVGERRSADDQRSNAIVMFMFEQMLDVAKISICIWRPEKPPLLVYA